MFALAKVAPNLDELKNKLANPKAGAYVTFEGWVRNHNDGRSVESLYYEAFEPLAITEANKILTEAKEVFDIYDAVCVHRVGQLAIGDLAVWVGVNAAHRGTAFDACRYVIDQIKTRLPIWKREVYIDGSSEWVNCQACAAEAGHSHLHLKEGHGVGGSHESEVGKSEAVEPRISSVKSSKSSDKQQAASAQAGNEKSAAPDQAVPKNTQSTAQSRVEQSDSSELPVHRAAAAKGGDGHIGVGIAGRQPAFSMPEVRPGFSLPEAQYYARQTILPSVGAEGQEKLRNAKVLVIGAGGLGSSALLYLAGAGVGTIGICDYDLVELTNLHRQIMFTRFDIGKLKAESAAARLKSLNPFIDVRAYREKFTRKNATELFKQYDVVLDCSDNFETKFLANDVALTTGVVLVQASIYQYEGQLQLLHSAVKEGKATARYAGQCLRCLWPNLSAGAEELNCIGSCAEVGVLGVVPGLFGTMQATETLKYVLGLETTLVDRVLIFDLLTYNLRTVKRRINPNCVCQTPDSVHPLAALSNAVEPREDFELSYHESTELAPLTLIDVREPAEVLVSEKKVKRLWSKAPVLHHPLSAKDNVELALREDRQYLVICARGIRSKRFAKTLREMGCTNVFSLSGGLAGVTPAQLSAAQAPELAEVDE